MKNIAWLARAVCIKLDRNSKGFNLFEQLISEWYI